MRKIAVSLSKGGVGKTTTAVNLAAGIARGGKRVLLVDTDTQGQTRKMLGVAPEAGLAEVVTGEATFEDAAIEARERLWLLAGGRELAGVKRLIDRKDFSGEKTLGDALQPLEKRFDYLICDTSPGWDALTVNVLFAVNEVLAPVSLEALTLDSLIEFQKSLIAVQGHHPNLQLKYVVPTFLDGRVKKSAEILLLLEKHFAALLCPSVRYSVRISEAPAYGQTIFEYAPSSTGAADYTALTEAVMRNGRT